MKRTVKYVLLPLLLLLQLDAHSQIITTIAGNGVLAHSGDGGPATAASLNGGFNCAVDSAGNIYITEALGNRIRKVSTLGIITTIAGTGTAGFSGDGGPATAAKLYNPVGIALDSVGNIFFADEVNNRVRKISPTGIISTVAGKGTAAYSGDGGAATLAELHFPLGIVLDKDGNLYVSDLRNRRIRKINTAGIITTIAGTGVVAAHSPDGTAATAAFICNHSLTIDNVGNLYFTDGCDHYIQKVTTAGLIYTIAGNGSGGHSGDGGQATAASLSTPQGIGIDNAGTIFFTDSDSGYVRKISTSGIISTIAGNGVMGFSGDGGPAILAQLKGPYGLATTKKGDLYIADKANYRIRKINSTVGVKDIESSTSSLLLYPNPSHNTFKLKINTATDENATIMVTDVTGRLIKMCNGMTNKELEITVDAPKGIYFTEVRTQSDRWVEKVLIQ